MHLDNAINRRKVYNYYSFNNRGIIRHTEDMSIHEVLSSEVWTIVSLQQNCAYSGIYESYRNFEFLLRYVKWRVPNDTKIVLHQTWACPPNATSEKYELYNYDASIMYEMICHTVNRIVGDFGLDGIVPAGTAVENARKHGVGTDLTRDGVHLSREGAFVACAAWCEYLTGIDSRDNPFVPTELKNYPLESAREAAHMAIENPLNLSY